MPFLAWIATNAPHAPLDCPEEYEKKYAGKVKPNVAKFFGMIANIDDNVGKLLSKLQRVGPGKRHDRDLHDRQRRHGRRDGVQCRHARHQDYAVPGWHARVPFFISWKGRIPEGVDIDKLAAHVDVMPTFADLAGINLADLAAKEKDRPQNFQLDGRSLLPLLENKNAPWADRFLFIHLGRWEKGQAAKSQYAGCAVRNSRFRLVNASNKKMNWELFDIKADPGETKNVIAEHPEVFKEMKAAQDRWWLEVQPELVNEDAVGPRYNTFHELYWKQFGGGPKEK